MLSLQLLNQPLQLARLELLVLDLPQKASFTSGIGVRRSRKVLIVKWIDAQGVEGYGECSCRPDPYYSEEYLDGALLLVQRFIVGQLTRNTNLRAILDLLRRIRGWNFTKAAVEAAAFQVARTLSGYQLSQDLQASPIDAVPVGISLGFFKDKVEAYDRVQSAIAEGYRRIKLKIAPNVDTAVYEHLRPLFLDHAVPVAFDANGSFFANDLDRLGWFVDAYDSVIEQPLPPDRFDLLLAAKARYPKLRVCADEEVTCIGDLLKLHALGAIDELNLKPGRVGGIAKSVEILNDCQALGIPCWIGGMFETGIGRVLNLELARFLPDATAHDLSPSSRYFIEDIITPEVEMDAGLVRPAGCIDYRARADVMQRLQCARYTYDY